MLSLLGTGCSVVTWTSPGGERFSRASLGANTAISGLVIEAGTNGLRRFDLRGYRTEGDRALGVVTEAAIRAAVSGPK